MGLFFRPRRPLMRLAAGAATASDEGQMGKARVQPDDIDEPARAAYATLAPVATDSTAELERLANLHSAGALTDREFTAAKARLLGL